jgi:hypothetical protein
MKGLTWKNMICIAVVIGLVLLIPLTGTLLHSIYGIGGWNWSPGGFVVMGALLFGFGLALVFVAKNVKNPVCRVVVCALMVLMLIAIWTEIVGDRISQALHFLFS